MINSEIRNWMLKPYVFIWALIPVRGRFQFGLWPRRKPFHSEAREQHLHRYWSPQHFIFPFDLFCSFRSKSIEFQFGRLLGLVSCQHYVVGRLGTRCLLCCWDDVCDCRSLVEITMRNWKCLCLLSLVSSNIASVPSSTFGEDNNAKAKVQSCRLLSGPA